MTSKVATQRTHYLVEFEDGARFEVLVNPDDPRDVIVDGTPRDVRLEPRDSGFVLSTEGGRREPLRLRFEHGDLVAETPSGERIRARVTLARADQLRRQILERPPPPAPLRPARLEAPIAGNVAALLVADGAAVQAGEPLLVLEAMKMQNTIAAHRPGNVRFEVAVGQTVRAGEALAVISSVDQN